MPFAAALSTATATARAARRSLSQAGDRLGRRPELAVVFFSPHHADAAAAIARTPPRSPQPKALIGCIGEAIVGTGQEIEHAPALSLWLGRLGRARRPSSRST